MVTAMTNKYLILGALVAAVGVAFMLKKGAGAVEDAANAVNPLNNNNVINQGFTSVYQQLTGSTGTLGTDLYDATHTGVMSDVSWWEALNPAAAAGHVAANEIKQATNWDNWSLGTKIYDWTH